MILASHDSVVAQKFERLSREARTVTMEQNFKRTRAYHCMVCQDTTTGRSCWVKAPAVEARVFSSLSWWAFLRNEPQDFIVSSPAFIFPAISNVVRKHSGALSCTGTETTNKHCRCLHWEVRAWVEESFISNKYKRQITFETTRKTYGPWGKLTALNGGKPFSAKGFRPKYMSGCTVPKLQGIAFHFEKNPTNQADDNAWQYSIPHVQCIGLSHVSCLFFFFTFSEMKTSACWNAQD